MENFHYHIDIVPGCNLRCPSCPEGNSPDVPRPKGMMSLDMYREIIDKIRLEVPARRFAIGLFNWTEPFLHPQVPEFVRIAREYEVPVHVSSNLSISRNIDEVIRAEPLTFRISVSGFTQEKYSETHGKGNIETAKANMRKVRQALDRYESKTSIQLVYLCYVHNMGAEYDSMSRLCRELGFSFRPCWAFLMPMEKYLEHFEKGLVGDDRAFLDLLAVHPDEAKAISLRHMRRDCVLRSHQTAINCDGSVALCCGAYDSRHDIAKNFLEVSHDDLQAAKYAHPLCERCMKHGIHVTVTYGGIREWNAVAAKRLHPLKVPKELVPPSFAGRLLRKALRTLRLA